MSKNWIGFYSFIFFLIYFSTQLTSASASDEIKISLGFPCRGYSTCQLALTQDSVGVLENDENSGGLEPDDENGFSAAVWKQALTPTQKDTAQMLLTLTHTWKGLKRYGCEKNDGYRFSIWSDSLSLHCNNCFSCTDGLNLHEAKTLAKFGKLSLWVYQIQ